MQSVASLACAGERTALLVVFVLKVLSKAIFGGYNDYYNSAAKPQKLGLLCRTLSFSAPRIIMLFLSLSSHHPLYAHMPVGLYCSWIRVWKCNWKGKSNANNDPVFSWGSVLHHQNWNQRDSWNIIFTLWVQFLLALIRHHHHLKWQKGYHPGLQGFYCRTYLIPINPFILREGFH